MTHTSTRIGVDPGTTGAIALLDANTHELISVHDTPTCETKSGKKQVDAIALAALIRLLNPDTAVVEAVHSMPRDGAVSAFGFGRSAGVVAGVLAALGITTTYVTPQVWKKRAGLIGTTKAASRKLAQTLWPDHAASFKLAKSDGKAEAGLIARYG